MFKNPTAVVETTRGRVDFEFNLGTGRSKSIVTTEAGTIVKNKYYSGVSTVEVIEKPAQSFQFITYIAGSPYDAVVALEKTYTISGTTYTASTEEYLYLHRDYQGTILAISGNAGVIKERRQFDPWGVLKKYYKGNVETPPSGVGGLDFEFLTDRGYTGHEHFFSVGIIHMNGRIYDPVLRTFLSADPLISRPNDSQNYNRYAYAMNNPLLYVDYDGYEPITIGTAILIAAIIGGTTYTAVALYNGNFTWGGLAKSIVVGAATGAVTFGVGQLAGSIFTNSASGFWQGAYQGAVIGAITGVGGAAANAIFNGENLTLKTLIKGAIVGGAIGAVVGGIQGGLRAQEEGLTFWKGEKWYEIKIGSGRLFNSIPAVDDFSSPKWNVDQSLNISQTNQNGQWDCTVACKQSVDNPHWRSFIHNSGARLHRVPTYI
jgi:RHS repeat-associated protein